MGYDVEFSLLRQRTSIFKGFVFTSIFVVNANFCLFMTWNRKTQLNRTSSENEKANRIGKYILCWPNCPGPLGTCVRVSMEYRGDIMCRCLRLVQCLRWVTYFTDLMSNFDVIIVTQKHFSLSLLTPSMTN